MFFEYFIVVLLGLTFGSFGNVCIYRLPVNKSIIPPSHCRYCKTPIKYFDNVPVIAYVLLKGKTRCCKQSISIQYPIIEVLTALIALWIFSLTGLTTDSILLFILILSLLIIFMTDLNEFIIPNSITYFIGPLGLVITYFQINPFNITIIDSLMGGIICGGIFFSISKFYLIVKKKEGLGMGDIKMISMLGFWLGIESTMLVIISSSFVGSIIGIALIVANKLKSDEYIPFGCFISVAAGVIIYLQIQFNFNLYQLLN